MRLRGILLGLLICASTHAAAADLQAIEQAISAGRLTQARLMLSRIDVRAVDQRRMDLLLGRYYLAQRQDALALARFQQVLAADPASPAATGAGIASLRLGRHAEARSHLLAAVAHDGRDAQAWNGLAVIADAARDWAAADQAYDRALAAQPHDAAILNNHGYSLILRRRFADALAVFSRAAQAAPDDRVVRNNLELARALAGDYPQPIAAPDATDDEQARKLNNAGYAAWLNGDIPAARALLARAIETRTSHYGLAERNLAIVEKELAE